MQCQALLKLYRNTYILLFCIDLLCIKPCQVLWFDRTHLPLFRNMLVNICSIFFLSSRFSNFKINYLKDKMRYGMWVHILLNNLASSHNNASIILRYLSLKFSCEQIIKAIGLILQHNMLTFINMHILFLLVKVWVKHHALFLTVITQIRTLS